MQRIHPQFVIILRGMLIGGFVLPLLLHAYVSTFTRYMADDYCSAADVQTLGVIEATRTNYINWSGRYAYLVTIHSLFALSPRMARFFPAVLIIALIGSLIWVYDQLLRITRTVDQRFLSLLFGVVTAFAIIAGTPHLFQSIYWITGAVTYLLPLVLLTLYIGLTVHTYLRSWSWPRLALSALIVFYAAGLSETSAVLQVGLFGLTIPLVWRFLIAEQRRQMLIWLAVGMFATLIGLLIVIFAPGNVVRGSLFPKAASFPTVVSRLVPITLAFIAADIAYFSPLPLLITLILAFWGSRRTVTKLLITPNRVRQLLLILSILMIGFVMLCMLPAVYVMSDAPPARAYLIPHFLLVWTALAWGWVMGLGFRKTESMSFTAVSRRWFLGACIVAAVPLFSAVRTQSITRDYPIFAEEWDIRDQLLKQAAVAGDYNPRVPSFSYDIAISANLESLGSDPLAAFNPCAARYYGLQSVAVANTKDKSP